MRRRSPSRRRSPDGRRAVGSNFDRSAAIRVIDARAAALDGSSSRPAGAGPGRVADPDRIVAIACRPRALRVMVSTRLPRRSGRATHSAAGSWLTERTATGCRAAWPRTPARTGAAAGGGLAARPAQHHARTDRGGSRRSQGTAGSLPPAGPDRRSRRAASLRAWPTSDRPLVALRRARRRQVEFMSPRRRPPRPPPAQRRRPLREVTAELGGDSIAVTSFRAGRRERRAAASPAPDRSPRRPLIELVRLEHADARQGAHPGHGRGPTSCPPTETGARPARAATAPACSVRRLAPSRTALSRAGPRDRRRDRWRGYVWVRPTRRCRDRPGRRPALRNFRPVARDVPLMVSPLAHRPAAPRPRPAPRGVDAAHERRRQRHPRRVERLDRARERRVRRGRAQHVERRGRVEAERRLQHALRASPPPRASRPRALEQRPARVGRHERHVGGAHQHRRAARSRARARCPVSGWRGSSGSSQRSAAGQLGQLACRACRRPPRARTPRRAPRAGTRRAACPPAASSRLRAAAEPASRCRRPAPRRSRGRAYPAGDAGDRLAPAVALGSFIGAGRSLETAVQRADRAERARLRVGLRHPHRRARLGDRADGVRVAHRAHPARHRRDADLLAHAGGHRAVVRHARRVLAAGAR